MPPPRILPAPIWLLQELRRIMREQRRHALHRQCRPPVLQAARAVPGRRSRRPHASRGRVARSALETLWTWVRRDLLPDDAKILADDVGEAMLAGDAPKADHINRACFKTARRSRLRRALKPPTPMRSPPAFAGANRHETRGRRCLRCSNARSRAATVAGDFGHASAASHRQFEWRSVGGVPNR